MNSLLNLEWFGQRVFELRVIGLQVDEKWIGKDLLSQQNHSSETEQKIVNWEWYARKIQHKSVKTWITVRFHQSAHLVSSYLDLCSLQRGNH